MLQRLRKDLLSTLDADMLVAKTKDYKYVEFVVWIFTFVRIFWLLEMLLVLKKYIPITPHYNRFINSFISCLWWVHNQLTNELLEGLVMFEEEVCYVNSEILRFLFFTKIIYIIKENLLFVPFANLKHTFTVAPSCICYCGYHIFAVCFIILILHHILHFITQKTPL